MPFEIVRNDIVNMQVDAIVNTANPKPVIGSGTDAAIHAKAGPALLEARKGIGPIRSGDSAITPAFDLDAKYVIHTVGPVWRGGLFGEEKKLRACYDSALNLAQAHGCQSIAFPLISTGNYGFPKDKALQIAVAAFSECLLKTDMRIYLVVFDRKAFRLSEKLMQSVSSYIDEHYVEERHQQEYEQHRISRRRQWEEWEETQILEEPCCADAATFFQDCDAQAQRVSSPVISDQPLSLEDLLCLTEAGFSEKLLELIDKTGKKDSEIYKKANVSKQHFSKIRNNPYYQPNKQTAIAFALALELDLEQTRDLIGRAGFALSSSSKFDLIIRYFIERKQYNIIEINMMLYEFDQTLLGA